MSAASTADLEALRAEIRSEMLGMNQSITNRIDLMTAEMQTVPGRVQAEASNIAQGLRNEFVGIVDGRAQVIERLIAMINTGGDARKKSSKPFKADTLLPNVWAG